MNWVCLYSVYFSSYYFLPLPTKDSVTICSLKTRQYNCGWYHLPYKTNWTNPLFKRATDGFNIKLKLAWVTYQISGDSPFSHWQCHLPSTRLSSSWRNAKNAVVIQLWAGKWQNKLVEEFAYSSKNTPPHRFYDNANITSRPTSRHVRHDMITCYSVQVGRV